MKPRKALGNKNQVGTQITALRKKHGMKQKELMAYMQVEGVDINPTSLSKLEGQQRIATADELRVIAKVFHVQMEELFPAEEKRTAE